jgi:hypothetical protein
MTRRFRYVLLVHASFVRSCRLHDPHPVLVSVTIRRNVTGLRYIVKRWVGQENTTTEPPSRC